MEDTVPVVWSLTTGASLGLVFSLLALQPPCLRFSRLGRRLGVVWSALCGMPGGGYALEYTQTQNSWKEKAPSSPSLILRREEIAFYVS